MPEKKIKKGSKPTSNFNPKIKVVKKKSMSSDLRGEIEDLHEAIADLHEDLKRMAPPSALKRAGRSFTGGILKGLGFIFGTTIIAGLLFWGAQKALKSEGVQTWITEKITEVVSGAAERAIPNIELPNF